MKLFEKDNFLKNGLEQNPRKIFRKGKTKTRKNKKTRKLFYITKKFDLFFELKNNNLPRVSAAEIFFGEKNFFAVH